MVWINGGCDWCLEVDGVGLKVDVVGLDDRKFQKKFDGTTFLFYIFICASSC